MVTCRETLGVVLYMDVVLAHLAHTLWPCLGGSVLHGGLLQFKFAGCFIWEPGGQNVE